MNKKIDKRFINIMHFNKIKNRKYGVSAILFIGGIYLSNLLNHFFDGVNAGFLEKIEDKMPSFINWLISIFIFKIPVYSLLLGFVIVWLFFAIYGKIKISGNKLKIMKAIYGNDEHFIDITKELNDKVDNNKLKEILSNSIAGDPIKGTAKKGIIEYKYNGQSRKQEYKEGNTIELPLKNK